ncbi:MAG: C4-dicarboxylate ABC transporter permease [Denitrovibrio sp.]|nr:MAG: C4-dicarboxylate ABC transporter permease [Denitrovibrio sp.]
MYVDLKKFEKIIFDAAAVFLVLFYSYSALIKPASTEYHKGIYVFITYLLVFLVYKSKNKWFRILDYILIIAACVTVAYFMIFFVDINYRAGAETLMDQWMSVVGVLMGIEVARRAVGAVFVLLGSAMILYGVYGDKVPDIFQHSGGDFLDTISVAIFLTNDGVFGIMADVLATYVLLFVLFGAFLEKSCAQKFFIDLPLAAVGHKTGGPAKVAVIASAIFGSISGSAIANTVSTGAFTIPLMKKAGFKPHVAGAIEPAASIGGMFMPPIMGAGGFIMAELTEIPYSNIMIIAIFPALMYFFSVFVMVHYEAKLHNIRGEKSKESAMDIFKAGWHYMMPLILITILMVMGKSPGYAAVSGMLSCLIITWTRGARHIAVYTVVLLAVLYVDSIQGFNAVNETSVGLGALVAFIYAATRKELKINIMEFVEASRLGTESSLKIGATVGVIGIIISMLTFSGLTLTFSSIIIHLAAGKLWLTILLIAVASLVLGMGVPVTAAYLITAVVAVPSLTELGVSPIAAHMIVYWLSQDSNITPPVCIAAFAGATIAKANMWLTAFNAFKFAKFLYLGPFLFAYVPAFSSYQYITATDTYQWFPLSTLIITFTAVIIGNFSYSYLLSFHWLVLFKKKKPVS